MEDDRVMELSAFAPLKREYVLRPEDDGEPRKRGHRKRKGKDQKASGSRPNLKPQGTQGGAKPRAAKSRSAVDVT